MTMFYVDLLEFSIGHDDFHILHLYKWDFQYQGRIPGFTGSCNRIGSQDLFYLWPQEQLGTLKDAKLNVLDHNPTCVTYFF